MFYPVAITVALGALWIASLPSASFWDIGLTLLGVFLLGLVWFFRMLWAIVLLERRPLRAWAWPPVAGLLLAVLLVAQAPVHARFTLAQGELTDIAEVLSAADRPTISADDLSVGLRIGSYLITRVDFDGRVVLFRFGDDTLIGGGGDGGMRTCRTASPSPRTSPTSPACGTCAATGTAGSWTSPADALCLWRPRLGDALS